MLCDFGIAWHNEHSPEERYGDIPYVAPEHRHGSHVSESCDVFSLGIVLYEMLTGHRPYPQDEGGTGAQNAPTQTASVAPPSKQRGVSPQLDAVVLRAIARRPSDRYSTMSDFLEDLVPAQLELAAKSARRTPTWRQVLRYGVGLLLIALLILVSFAAGLRVWENWPSLRPSA